MLKFLAVFLVAGAHMLLYLGVFGAVFAAGDAREDVPPGFRALLYLLGAPLMYLSYLPLRVLAPRGRWWGDDGNLLVGLAVLNALCWGSGIVWLATRGWGRSKRSCLTSDAPRGGGTLR